MEEIEVEIKEGNLIQVDGTSANIFVFGKIGGWFGYSKLDLIKLFRSGNITEANLYINSPGGDLAEALSMYDLIKGSDGLTTTAYIFGQCASAATVLACAANKVVMSKQCLYLTHKPLFGETGGNADQLREDAELLDTWEGIMTNLYQRKTGMDTEAIQSMLRQDVYINADTALLLGFVDEVVDNISINWALASSASEEFDWMTKNVYFYNSKDTETSMTGASAFRSAIYNCVTEGKFPMALPTQKTNDMNILQKIVSALKGDGMIQEGKEAAAIEALQKGGMIDEIVNAAVEQIKNSGDGAPPAAEKSEMTADEVMTALETMSDEQVESLRTRLGIVEKPAVDPVIEQVNNTVKDLADKVAGILNKRQNTPPQTNGKSDLGKGADAKAETAYSNVQLEYMVNAYNKKQLTDDDFETATKVSIARAREILAS